VNSGGKIRGLKDESRIFEKVLCKKLTPSLLGRKTEMDFLLSFVVVAIAVAVAVAVLFFVTGMISMGDILDILEDLYSDWKNGTGHWKHKN
jgi:hypothetical protein